MSKLRLIPGLVNNVLTLLTRASAEPAFKTGGGAALIYLRALVGVRIVRRRKLADSAAVSLGGCRGRVASRSIDWIPRTGQYLSDMTSQLSSEAAGARSAYPR